MALLTLLHSYNWRAVLSIATPNAALGRRWRRWCLLAFLFAAIAVPLTYCDTVYHSVSVLAACQGVPLIEDDIAAFERVRAHFRDDGAISAILQAPASGPIRDNVASGWKVFGTLSGSAARWNVEPGPPLHILGVRTVSFESDPSRSGTFGLTCEVLSCGLVKNCLTHDRATLSDRGREYRQQRYKSRTLA